MFRLHIARLDCINRHGAWLARSGREHRDRRRRWFRVESAGDSARGSRCAAWKIGPAALALTITLSPDVIRTTARHRVGNYLLRAPMAIAAATAIERLRIRFTGT
jgi:hypothetical protein